MTAPFREPATAAIGLALIAASVGTLAYYAWTRDLLWCNTAWPVTELVLNESAEAVSFEADCRWCIQADGRQDFDWHCETTPGMDSVPLADRIAKTETPALVEEIYAHYQEVRRG